MNLSTFDERYQLLEQALQDALLRLDQFMEKEVTLTNALDKLHSDLDSKMDSEAEKKLKKFMGRFFNGSLAFFYNALKINIPLPSRPLDI